MKMKWALRNLLRLTSFKPLLLCVMISCSLLTLGLLTYQYNEAVSIEVKDSFVTTVGFERKQLFTPMGDYIHNKRLILENDILKLTTLEEVERYNYRMISMGSNQIYKVNRDIYQEVMKDNPVIIEGYEDNRYFGLNGVRYVEQLDEFGKARKDMILDGRDFTTEDIINKNPVIIMNDMLADRLDLGVGDYFIMRGTSNPQSIEDISFQVIGISKRIEEEIYNEYLAYIPITILQNAEPIPEGVDITNNIGFSMWDVEFELKSPERAASFIRSAAGLYNQEYFTLQANDMEYKRTVAMVDSLNIVAATLSYLSLPAGILMLSILMVVAIRGRRSEIGILRAVGTGKKQATLQMMVEYAIILFIAIIIGILIGTISASYVADIMYKDIATLIGALSMKIIIIEQLPVILLLSGALLLLGLLLCYGCIGYYMNKKPLDTLRNA